MKTSFNEKSYRRDIDGLRALAVTSVVLFHTGLPQISGGFVGVDIFFVISGYLITAHIYKEIQRGSFSFVDFYIKRAKRIIPALFFVLLISFAVGLVVLSPQELYRFSLSAISATLGASNFYYWWTVDYFAPSSDHLPLLMTWSLGVEEQFYAIFPIVLLISARYARGKSLAVVLCLTFVSMLSSIVLVRINPVATFYMLPPRAWELGIGAALAIWEANGRSLSLRPLMRNLLAVGAIGWIAYCIGFYSPNTLFPGESAIPVVVGSALLIAVRSSVINSALSLQPVVYVGRISYSWYLWHWPLLAFSRNSSLAELTPVHAVIIVAIAFALAVLTYYLIEQPFRQTRRSDWRLLVRYAGAMVAIIVPLGLTAAASGLPWRFAPVVHETEQSIARREPCLAPYGVRNPVDNELCHLRAAGRPAIALLGDSHAAALADGLRHAADGMGYELIVMTKTSCPSLGSVTRYMPNHPGHDEQCAAFNRNTLEHLAGLPDVKGVVVTGYWSAPLIESASGSRYKVEGQAAPRSASENPQNLEKGLISQLQALKRLNVPVVVMQDVPIFGFDPVAVMLNQNISSRRFINDLFTPIPQQYDVSPPTERNAKQIDLARSAVERAVSFVAGSTLYDPSSDLCTDKGCRYADGNNIYYVDNQHLSRAGADLISRSIMAAYSDAAKASGGQTAQVLN